MIKNCFLFLLKTSFVCACLGTTFLTYLSLAQNLTSKTRQLLDFNQPFDTAWLKQYPEIEKQVLQTIENLKEQVQSSAESLFKEFPGSALLPYKLHVEELRQFQPEDSNIVSVRLKAYLYTGGAHGGTRYYNWNWNKKQKGFMSLEEIVSKDKLPALASLARTKLTEIQFERYSPENRQKYAWDIKDHICRGTNSPEEFELWNLHENNLILIFKEYQVASYSAGSFEISIPLPLKEQRIFKCPRTLKPW